MPDWITQNEPLLWWMGAAGLLMMLLTAIAIPIVVTRMPADYLINEDAGREHRASRNPVLNIGLLIIKNLFGWLLILAGIAMLIGPGQGVLAIFVGLTLISFPGKRRLLRWLLLRPSIHRAANWIRKRCGVEALKLPT